MKTPQVPAMPGMSPLGFRKSADGTMRCAKCQLHADTCTCDPNHPLWQILGLRPKAHDEKTVAERKWQQRKLAPAPQQQCDHGLFSDDHKQTELFK